MQIQQPLLVRPVIPYVRHVYSQAKLSNVYHVIARTIGALHSLNVLLILIVLQIHFQIYPLENVYHVVFVKLAKLWLQLV